MCVHEIQFLCGHSTVNYTSITILHWWICATVKYSYAITGGWGYCVRNTPILRAHSLDAAFVLRCVNHMRSASWNTTACRPVYHGVPKNYYTRCSLFCCAYDRLFIHGSNLPICLSGHDTWLFRIRSAAGVFYFHIPFLQAMCSRSVYMDLWWYAALR